MQYSDINWNLIWQESRRKKSWKKKKSTDWDRRAASFAKRNINSGYVDSFLDLMQPQKHWSVLDVGCGPGTLALPLAERVKSVTAVDFSKAMLVELQSRTAQEGIANIQPVEASWTDDWDMLSIPRHDVAISSRSLAVQDLQAALLKLNNYATKKVFIADKVGSGPFDPELFSSLGRPFDSGPDYIVTVNLLYQMGIHAKIDYIELEQSKVFVSRDEAVEASRWMLEDLTAEEEKKLESYVDARLCRVDDNQWLFQRRTPVKWAFISWDK
ncbi:MAG: class I SAM-dependent methyltransferase [Desulfobulbaceae bacterium]|uniref:Class I SAM-dependent methyltransferase n=1 Tax=Candidatus Desulfobia pelagia TaxID=2841692 RepID=A0A8J6NDB6_9BACT|nr:class I SAM-dependent methyltransferase [Candidatus Desulfobia pelagia]